MSRTGTVASSVRAIKFIKGLRKSFTFPTKDSAHYFPGHMSKGMRDMERKLRDVDCVIEVHDARIPFSGRNPLFQDKMMIRPHLLLLNKMDLTPECYRKTVEEKLHREENITNIMYTNCKEDINSTVKNEILPTVVNMIESLPRYSRQEELLYNLLIIGVPNVGKSSLINALRRTHLKKGKATSVGPSAGVTRNVLERIKVSNHPPIYVFDTPGVLHPRVDSIKVGMKLALCANLKDRIVGEEVIVDFMLHWLNTHQEFKYVDYYGLPEPTDIVYELLSHVAKKTKRIQRIRNMKNEMVFRPNFLQTAQAVLNDFRAGRLGKVNLDADILNKPDQNTQPSHWKSVREKANPIEMI